MVVQEAEVALDRFQTQLLQSEHHAEEHEVEVHDGFMHALQINNSKPESRNRQQ